jgi:hypothetical protein
MVFLWLAGELGSEISGLGDNENNGACSVKLVPCFFTSFNHEVGEVMPPLEEAGVTHRCWW